ncbi:TetR/AcrR family transcriptional regulator [Mycobacterium sp. 050134]|uniref:TetR/AcrR family transcriptional regulator n=1 Tax=Mycobacterium sp. 050134 TaxID=3096111 RepID=UPI002EDA55A5
MARQVRSEATRRKILDAAIDVFGEVGYAAAGWGTIIERTGMTKGALYHHFDSKESLASAIIQEGSETVLDAVRNVCKSSSPALENIVHGTFTIAKVLNSERFSRAAEQLTHTLGGFNEAASRFCTGLVEVLAAEARRATAEGDLRDDIDADVLSESIVAGIFGIQLLSNALSAEGPSGGVDITGRLSQIWELILPGVVSETSLPYFQQFLRREAMRHSHGASPRAEDGAQPD